VQAALQVAIQAFETGDILILIGRHTKFQSACPALNATPQWLFLT
jgi:hypothetical protein